MDFASDDIHNMQSDSGHILNPAVSDRRSSVFHMPRRFHVVYTFNFMDYSSVNLPIFFSFHMLLENERLLLVLADRHKYSIYLESLTGMDAALQGTGAIEIQRNKTGEDLFAYDEVKRMLVVYVAAKVRPIYLVNVGVLTYCPTR
jgi:hypothetical protein